MKRSILLMTALSALALAACDKPTVVNVPAAPAAAPGPAGPAGPAGNDGAVGKTGDGTTVVVMPPAASAPSN
jgi:hypothetical protein